MNRQFFIFTFILLVSCGDEMSEVEQNNNSDFKQPISKTARFSTNKDPVKAVQKEINFIQSTKNKTDNRTAKDTKSIKNSQAGNNYSEFDPFDEFDNQQIISINNLRNADYAEDRIKAIEELDDYDGSRIVKYVVSALDDPDSQVRIAAINKLSDMDLHAAVEGILYALSDRNPIVVVEALNSIENLSDSSLVPEVHPLLNHSNHDVQRKAKEVIEFLE